MASPAWYGWRESNSHSLGPEPSAPPLSHTHVFCGLRRKGSNLRRAGQSRMSYRWTTPELSSLRKESDLRARAYEARLPPRSAAVQRQVVTKSSFRGSNSVCIRCRRWRSTSVAETRESFRSLEGSNLLASFEAFTNVVPAAFDRSGGRESHPDPEAGDLVFFC